MSLFSNMQTTAWQRPAPSQSSELASHAPANPYMPHTSHHTGMIPCQQMCLPKGDTGQNSTTFQEKVKGCLTDWGNRQCGFTQCFCQLLSPKPLSATCRQQCSSWAGWRASHPRPAVTAAVNSHYTSDCLQYCHSLGNCPYNKGISICRLPAGVTSPLPIHRHRETKTQCGQVHMGELKPGWLSTPGHDTCSASLSHHDWGQIRVHFHRTSWL